MSTIVPNDRAGLLTSLSLVSDQCLVESAVNLKLQIRRLQDALEDHTSVLRERVEASKRRSGKFGEIEVTLKSRYSIICSCHKYDVRRCDKLGVSPVEVEKIEVGRYVNIEDKRTLDRDQIFPDERVSRSRKISEDFSR